MIEFPFPSNSAPHEPEYQYQVAPEPNNPPLTVSSELFPGQTDDGYADIDVGSVEIVFTVIVVEIQLVLLQSPSALTLYVVVITGETVIEEPFPREVPPHEPEYQNQSAPVPISPSLTVKTELSPGHIEDGVADTDVGSVEFSFKETVVATHKVLLRSPSALTK